MLKETRIILLDDDDVRSHLLSALFDFVGLDYMASDFVSWFQRKDLAELLNAKNSVIFLGSCSLPVSMAKMLGDFRQLDPHVAVVTVADWDDAESVPMALKGMLIGSFLPPHRQFDLLDILHQAQVYRQQRMAANGQLKLWQDHARLFQNLVGLSASMQQVRAMMLQVADSDVSVLITGESGTGKEVVARNLHESSSRQGKPFVPVNCGAIPAELLESELFGHEKGAFTGAVSARVGRFEMADGGTLFLDEIGDMPLSMQVKLLRILQERCFERVGGNRTIEVDVRIIAATHKNLEEMIAESTFREDLYYRLNVFPIEMPPLRDRLDDLPLLINELVSRAERHGFGRLQFHPSAIRVLAQYGWAGNVRELANLIERLAIMHPGQIIGVGELPAKFRQGTAAGSVHEALTENEQLLMDVETISSAVIGETASAAEVTEAIMLPDDGMDLKGYLNDLEQTLIDQSLDQANGVVARAAELLQIRRTTLVEKMRKYNIQRK